MKWIKIIWNILTEDEESHKKKYLSLEELLAHPNVYVENYQDLIYVESFNKTVDIQRRAYLYDDHKHNFSKYFNQYNISDYSGFFSIKRDLNDCMCIYYKNILIKSCDFYFFQTMYIIQIFARNLEKEKQRIETLGFEYREKNIYSELKVFLKYFLVDEELTKKWIERNC